MNYPRKASAVIRAHDELIMAFRNKSLKISTLAKYFFLKLKFPNSWLYNDLNGAAERTGTDTRTVQRWLSELMDTGLALRQPKGYRLISIKKAEEYFVKPRRRKHLSYSRTLCIVGKLNTWKEVQDLLYLKLLERHARRIYFQARHDGDLLDVIEQLDQRTKRNDRINDGESLAILIPMSSIMNVLNLSKNSVQAWKERMKNKGYVKTKASFQAVTEILGPKGPIPLGKMNSRQFEAFKEENPKLLKGHIFLGRNGQLMNKSPLAWEFTDYPLFHSEPKRHAVKKSVPKEF